MDFAYLNFLAQQESRKVSDPTGPSGISGGRVSQCDIDRHNANVFRNNNGGHKDSMTLRGTFNN